MDGVGSALFGLSQPVLELGEELLDRVQIGRNPIAVRPRDLLWFIAAELVRLDAAGLAKAPDSVDRVLIATSNCAAAR